MLFLLLCSASIGSILWALITIARGPPSTWGGSTLRAFRLAASNGDAQAQLRLGQMHVEGECVGRDYGEALRRFRAAAETGLVEAQLWIGEPLVSSALVMDIHVYVPYAHIHTYYTAYYMYVDYIYPCITGLLIYIYKYTYIYNMYIVCIYYMYAYTA